MLVFVKDNFAYLSIPKNGSTTFNFFLERHGWKPFAVIDNNLDLSKFKVWGHLTDPEVRHTKGVVEYLIINKKEDVINDEFIGKMLVSGVFDSHSYTVTSMLGAEYASLPIHWIPLDVNITKWNRYPTPVEQLNGNDLTNDFFKQHNINLKITNADMRHQSTKNIVELQKQINNYKIKYHHEYMSLFKHVLEPDVVLYNKIVEIYREKYLHPEYLNK